MPEFEDEDIYLPKKEYTKKLSFALDFEIEPNLNFFIRIEKILIESLK